MKETHKPGWYVSSHSQEQGLHVGFDYDLAVRKGNVYGRMHRLSAYLLRCYDVGMTEEVYESYSAWFDTE